MRTMIAIGPSAWRCAAYVARPWWRKSPEDWPALARWVWERVR